MTLYKLVNGQRVAMSKEEEAAIKAERITEAQKPVQKTLEERVAELEKRVAKLEK